MPSPALVIGLGGTGTLVATYIKKELMETSGGQWPLKEVKVLAFDTDTRQPEIGGQGQIRQVGQSTGAVRLGTGEFFPITGTVQQLMRDVAAGQYPYIGKWLLADWYLRNLPDKMFNLNEGAGQFRQFGRLAVFRDLATPGQSTVFNTLNDALVKLSRDNPTLKNLQVFIVGSLAGGTGAGMFADIAYLVRKLADQSTVNLKTKMSIRGYLVLPDAFSQTIESNWLRSMHARAFAAMRENRRFTVSFDYERGYPIHYREGSDDPIWHSSLKGKLFDLMYYVDGNGERGRLNAVKMDRGVAPMLADTISAAIDRESGPVFASYVANVEAERLNRVTRGEFSEKTATFGSVGTYSLVFPIYQIVEGWTHNLGLEVLNALTRPDPKSADTRSGVPKGLLSNANQENPGDDGRTAATNFLRATKPIAYQGRDEHGNTIKLEAEPTLLFGELARIAEMTVKPGSAVMQELMARSIDEWKPLFVPGGEDRETQRLIQRVENILNMRMYDKSGQLGTVLASDQTKPKEAPPLGADRIPGEVRNYKARLLGEEDPRTGQRSGGNYRSALAQIAEYQLARFNLYLDVFAQVTLNGSPNRLGTESRGGKLGYLSEFLDTLFQSLVHAQETLQRVQQNRREKGDTRRNAIAEAQETLQRMKSLSDKKGLLGGPAGEAYHAQHAYLQAENHLIDILQTEALEDVLLDTLNRMIDYVNSARESVKSWVQTLVTSSDSLYASLLRGRKQMESDRAAERDIRCRLVVSDSEYEEERYQNYLATIENGWFNALLGALEWEMQTKMRGGRPKMELTLKVRLPEANKVFTAQAGDDNNVSHWLNLCRQPFVKARQTESVIGYLVNHREYKNPAKMADVIFKNLSVALAHQGGNPLAANFLRAYFQTEEEAGHREYLRRVIQEMAQLSSKRTVDAQPEEGGAAPQEDKFVQFSNSEDRFKFTVVFTNELLELEKIAAYEQGRQAYLGSGDEQAKGDRRVLHIFPAEVHAAEYEARLPAALKQQMRLFADDLVLQLEDVNQFRQFLMCYVYGLIRNLPERDSKTGVTRFVFKLILPPEREFDEYGNPTHPEEIWLTKPSGDVSMLPALMTFNFIGKDIGHDETYVRRIDYDAVARALNAERERDAQRHVEASDFAYNTDLLTSIHTIRDEKERLNTFLELTRIERISQKRNEIEAKTLPYWEKEKSRNPQEGQKEYDLASVFLLMLNDEIKAVRAVVDTKIRTLRELGLLS
jgi:hypothetical protein